MQLNEKNNCKNSKSYLNVTHLLFNRVTGKLSNKLALLFSVLISLLIYVSSSLTYTNFSNALQNDFISKSKSNLKLYNISFEEYYEKIRDLSLVFRKDDQMMEFMTYSSDDLSRQRYVEARIKELFFSRNDIEQISIFIPLTAEFYSVNRSKTILDTDKDSNYKERYWYKRVVEAKDNSYTEAGFPRVIESDQMTETNEIITFHRAIIDLETQKVIGVITLSMNLNKTKNVFYDEYENRNEVLALLDQDGMLYFSNDSAFFTRFVDQAFISNIDKDISNGMEFITEKENEKYQIIYDISEKYGWKMLKIIPLDTINSSAKMTRNTIIIVGVIFWVFSVLFVMIISQAITRSLGRLTKKMDLVGEGVFNVQIETKGNDEIAYLSKKFNHMILRINELINEEYIAKVAEKSARLKALEAQINPHFIYNSLQAISTKALQRGMFDVSEMIEALGSNLRYAIKGKEMVKVSEELIYVQNYVLLQKSRFGDRLSVQFEIDREVLDWIIPKLFIQVLIENSVVHGLEKTLNTVTIIVRANIDGDYLSIYVRDDGNGIAPEDLNRIRKDLSEGSFAEEYHESLGLKNLNARLKIIYEGNAFLKINSTLKKGTEVHILLPRTASARNQAFNNQLK